MYYVMYLEDDSDYETVVVPLEEPISVTTFIEEKINNHNYSLDDFNVVRGVEVNLQTIKIPVKILMTN